MSSLLDDVLDIEGELLRMSAIAGASPSACGELARRVSEVRAEIDRLSRATIVIMEPPTFPSAKPVWIGIDPGREGGDHG